MNKIIQTLMLSSLLFPLISHAGVTIGVTRVIYHGDARDESVTIINDDKEPYLIQSWAQKINSDGSSTAAPFIVTPPLFRLNAGQRNVLRVIRTGGSLPEDRESLYWLDIKSIPTSNNKDNHNKIRLAVKAEFKLIFSAYRTERNARKIYAAATLEKTRQYFNGRESYGLLYEFWRYCRRESKTQGAAICRAV